MNRAEKRVAAVRDVRMLMSNGMSQVAACARAGVSPTNYRRWSARFVEGGIEGLKDKPKSGRPKKSQI